MTAYNSKPQFFVMDPLLLLFLGVVGVWGFDLLQKAGGAGSLNFVISGVQVNQSGINTALLVALNIQNPSNASYQIKSFAGNLYLNDTLTGSFSSFMPVNVSPNSETPVQITVLLQPGAVVSDIVSLFNGPQSLVVRMLGTANAGLSIPFDVKYTLL